MSACIFCRIADGAAPAYVVYEDKYVLAILDKYPVSEGHTLVITRDHYTNVTDAPLRVSVHAFRVASALAKIFKWKLGALGVNIISNAGRAAYQEVMHFHIHVIPRWESRGPLFSGRHELTREEASRVLARLSPHMDLLRELVEGLMDIP